MAKCGFIVALCFVCIFSLFSFGYSVEDRFFVEGKVYCDTCRAKFVTKISEYMKGNLSLLPYLLLFMFKWSSINPTFLLTLINISTIYSLTKTHHLVFASTSFNLSSLRTLIKVLQSKDYKIYYPYFTKFCSEPNPIVWDSKCR